MASAALTALPNLQVSTPATGRRRPARITNATDEREQSAAAASELEGQTRAFAQGAQQNFSKDVGTLLGNLNALGGIRSGGVKAGVQDLASTYGQQIGLQAAQTAAQAADIGTRRAAAARQQGQFDQDLAFRRESDATRHGEFESDLGFRRERGAADDAFHNAQLSEAQAARLQSHGEFEEGLGFQRERATADDDRFATTFGENQRQFNEDLGFRNRSLTQNQSQFDEDLGFRRDQLGQQGHQFDEDLAFRRGESTRQHGEFEEGRDDANRQWGVERFDTLGKKQFNQNQRDLPVELGGETPAQRQARLDKVRKTTDIFRRAAAGWNR